MLSLIFGCSIDVSKRVATLRINYVCYSRKESKTRNDISTIKHLRGLTLNQLQFCFTKFNTIRRIPLLKPSSVSGASMPFHLRNAGLSTAFRVTTHTFDSNDSLFATIDLQTWAISYPIETCPKKAPSYRHAFRMFRY